MTSRTDRHGFGAIGLTVGQPTLPAADTLRLAELADEAGMDLLGAGDGFVENLSLMGALAARTRTIGLITCIVGWTRTPVTTALAGLTMQQLSGNRYRLGLGTMPREWSESWHGVEAARPLARMRDYVAAVRVAMASEPGRPCDHDGPYYRFSGYERPAPRTAAPPPIYLAATRPAMAGLAAEIADGVAFNLINSAEWLRDVCWPRMTSALAAAGRHRDELDVGILRYCAIADDRRRARDLVRQALAFYFAVPYFADMLEHHGLSAELARGRAALARGDRAGMAAAVSDEMVRIFALAGTADDVREQLAAYRRLVDWVLLCPPVMNAAPDTYDMALRIISTFAPAAVAA